MASTIKGFYVALTRDVSIEEFEAIKAAIGMIRGVESIEASISNSNDWINRMQVRRDVINKLYKVADELAKDPA